MRDVLQARGYMVEYIEFNGVHSELNWQDWLADGLIRLVGP
jgi:enterochelin esterase-like enzyme